MGEKVVISLWVGVLLGCMFSIAFALKDINATLRLRKLDYDSKYPAKTEMWLRRVYFERGVICGKRHISLDSCDRYFDGIPESKEYKP